MSAPSSISLEEYTRTSFHPDCDYIEGTIQTRNTGCRRHAYAQSHIAAWFSHQVQLIPLISTRIQVAPNRIRIPDIMVCQAPIPEEEVFTTPPCLCIEVISPEDTIASMQDRLDDYLNFGVPNIWVIDPWKHRGWTISPQGWATNLDGHIRTADGNVAMPLSAVLLPWRSVKKPRAHPSSETSSNRLLPHAR